MSIVSSFKTLSKSEERRCSNLFLTKLSRVTSKQLCPAADFLQLDDVTGAKPSRHFDDCLARDR